jgi:hypothetical protein
MRMRERYRRWMHDWEYRLTTRDTNRVVRPLEWGLDWAARWPLTNGDLAAGPDPERFLIALNQKIVADSGDFFSYQTPSDFRLETRISPPKPEAKPRRTPDVGEFLRFTSAVRTPFPENDLANARWFPAKGRRAVVVLPQWNADAESHNALCRIFNFLGIAVLRLSMPYHDVRKPPELERADYAVSSNIGRTIDAARQAITDIRSCLDWLESQGYTELGIMGTSLGSCYAFIAAAHDTRIRVAAYNHASTYFGDVVWTGQSTRHIREGVEGVLTQERLRDLWRAISPMSYFDLYERTPRKSLVIYATYDLTFLPEFSRKVVEEFKRRKLDCRISILPCGHYTTGETPYKFLDAWYIARFLNAAL